MKFADKYLDMNTVDDEEEGMIRAKTPEPCCQCGTQTMFVDINYEAFFCSEECRHEFERPLMQSE